MSRARMIGTPGRPADVRLDRLRSAIDEALAQCLDAELEGAAPPVAAPIRYAVLAPGKRVRPLLVLAAWEAAAQARAEEAPRGLLPLACATELVHAYSLVHDDLPCMDDDALRRGRPTVHVEYGVRAAIFAGAALMPLAVRTVGRAASEMGLPAATAAGIIATLTQASGGGGMVGGQLLDLRAEGRRVDAATLERIHLGKTARLMAASSAIGGLAAGVGDAVVERLSAYGRALGLAFQAVDDILDVTGSAQRMGKARGRDEALGKATLPSVLGLEAARARADELGAEALGRIEGLRDAEGLFEIARIVLERDR